jgi:NADH dehydrogenase FAD-containing subunit
LRHLRASDVTIRWPVSVARIDGQGVLLESGERHDCDMVVNAAGLLPPPLTRQLGLAVAEDGGLITDPFLRSASDNAIFVVGDCAAFDGKSLPRIGVYAVRQAPILLRNIVATLRGLPLLPFKPQRRYLSIVGLGRSTALLVRGNWWFKGPPALWLKRWIDQRFVQTCRRRSIGVRKTREN